MVVVLECSVMRWQPLRRALCTFLKSFLQIKLVHSVTMR
ncbi:putative acetyltransferase, partial [Vibrio cholerae O1 str. EM-1676A]